MDIEKTTKEKILEQAFKLFGEKGYDAASMEELARAVGIRKASLYAHFESKEALFRGLLHAEADGFVAMVTSLESLVRDALSPATLKAVFNTYMDHFKDKDRLAFMQRMILSPPKLTKGLGAHPPKPPMDFANMFAVRFGEAIGRGELNALSAERMSQAFFYLMFGYNIVSRFVPHLRVATHDEGQELVDILWKGMGA